MYALAAFALVAVLVRLAARRPERRAAREASELAYLTKVRELSLDEAEDGAVLARRMGKPKEEEYFRKKAESIKRGARRA